MAFKMAPPTFGKKPKVKVEVEQVTVIRKDLDDGVAGEANDDGSIFVSNKIEEGSKKEKEIVAHEGQHIKDMKSGKLAYNDDSIEWNGKKYERKAGMINYKGKWLHEGDKSFPWEKRAYKAGDAGKVK